MIRDNRKTNVIARSGGICHWNCARICPKSWRLTSRADLRVAAGGSEERRCPGPAVKNCKGTGRLPSGPLPTAQRSIRSADVTAGTGVLRAPRDSRVRL